MKMLDKIKFKAKVLRKRIKYEVQHAYKEKDKVTERLEAECELAKLVNWTCVELVESVSEGLSEDEYITNVRFVTRAVQEGECIKDVIWYLVRTNPNL